MSGLMWQDGKPAQPGYYWLRRRFMDTPYVDNIELFHDELVTIADGLVTSLSAQDITHFAGPIPEPEDSCKQL